MLMDRKVDFVCCDNPTATKFTIHILAAVAEHERDAISARTKAALAAAKANGKVLGNYERIAKAKREATAARDEAVRGAIADTAHLFSLLSANQRLLERLEAENAQLRGRVAELMLEIQALRDALGHPQSDTQPNRCHRPSGPGHK
jgi:DNA invertase Pin-like site-specific DNA recombinase